MIANPTVTSRVSLSRPRGVLRVEEFPATAFVSVTGSIAVEERSFNWPGLYTEDQVPMLLMFARWVIGRQLAEALRHPFDTTVASQTDAGWQTVFTWTSAGTPPITVTLPEFVSYTHADAAAREMVEGFIPTLVPDRVDTLRHTKQPNLAAKPPQWIEHILATAAVYP